MESTVSRTIAAGNGVDGLSSNAISASRVAARAQSENFPVAPFFLPRRLRADLAAIYGFARLVDDLGDEASGDRLAHLAWADAELDRAAAGTAEHEIFEHLGATIRAHRLDLQPFRDLIAANRRDQAVMRCATFDDLADYCRLSANPVGRLVLAVLGVATPERISLSDDVCTALQLVEHCQDVGEDARRGRVYLPVEDLDRCGCPITDLHAVSATPALAAVVAVELARVRGLLGSAVPLIATLHGRSRLLVAGFAAGGLAAADTIEANDHDVLRTACTPSKCAVADAAVRLLVAARTYSRREGGAS